MRLSVVIPCLNAAETISHQLDALAKQRWDAPWEIIISDNGSRDGTQAIVERYKQLLPDLRLIDSSDARGAAHARNLGAVAANGDALIFCDADDEVDSGWLSAMGEALLRHDFVACRLDFRKLNDLRTQQLYKDHPQTLGLRRAWFPPHLHHAGGGTIGIKKSLHEAVGGFDETLMAQEDTDYCFKIQLAGTLIQFEPRAVLYVRCREQLRGRFRQARVWAEYTVCLYKKYRSPKDRELWRWRSFVSQCKKLLISFPQVCLPDERALWVWNLGWQIGRLKGSIKYRVPPV